MTLHWCKNLMNSMTELSICMYYILLQIHKLLIIMHLLYITVFPV